MAQTSTKKALEGRLKDYLEMQGLHRAVEDDPWNYHVKRAYEQITGKERNDYSGANPSVMAELSDEVLERTRKPLENIPYNLLVQSFDNKNLKGLLAQLPELKDDGSVLARIHKGFCKVRERYEQGKKVAIKDPDAFREMAMDSATYEADASYAACGIDSSRIVFKGQYLEATRQLYAAINRVKPDEQAQTH